jgi:hypothetical protein
MRHRCLDPVAEIELLQDVRHVCLERRLADDQRLGDLGIREAARDQPQDIELTLGQLLQLQPARDRWGQRRLPVGDGANGRNQLRARNFLNRKPLAPTRNPS